jgi:hypothetical protein
MSDNSVIVNPRMADLFMMSSHNMDESTLIFDTQHGDLDSFNRLVLAE